MVNPFEELLEEITDRVRQAVREELKALLADKNGVDTTEFLNVEQTAKFLDCSKPHVYLLKERIPHIIRGSRLYFKVDDLKMYMDSGRVLPGKLKKAA